MSQKILLVGAACACLILPLRHLNAGGAAKSDAAVQLPSVQKALEAEDAYRKARETALKELDGIIVKAEATLAAALKEQTAAKDKDGRAKALAAVRKATDELKQLRTAHFRVLSPQLTLPVVPAVREETRFAARLERPLDIVINQLKLDKGQGVVIAFVEKNGAAAKAGLQVNDILVQIEGKSVPYDLKELRKLLSEIQPDVAVTATVIRQGQRETIKDLKLPAAPIPVAK